MSSIKIYSDRHLVYDPPRGGEHCVSLTSDEYESIQRYVDDDDFLKIFRQTAADAIHHGEYEEIFLKAADFEGSVPLEIAPVELRELLEAVASPIRRNTGKEAPWNESR